MYSCRCYSVPRRVVMWRVDTCKLRLLALGNNINTERTSIYTGNSMALK